MVTAYDKAGNKVVKTVGQSVDTELTVESNVVLDYGGSARTLTYTYGGTGTIEARSSDIGVATVGLNTSTKKLTISPVHAGSCEVILKAGANEHYNEMTARIAVTVRPRVAEFEWTGGPFEYDGSEHVVSATIKRNNIETLTWKTWVY